MNLEFALFFLFAAVAVIGAVSLILLRHPIHSALSLIVVMVALACLYLLIGAEFIAALQIIVYAGAIIVLFVFVIMLLNAGEEERTNFSKMARYAGVPLAVLLTLLFAYWMMRAGAEHAWLQSPPATPPVPLKLLGQRLFQEFVMPFELTAVLILVAILGAVVLARRES
jgi:NADH-quinone oxidoreductase subunit J